MYRGNYLYYLYGPASRQKLSLDFAAIYGIRKIYSISRFGLDVMERQ